MCNCLYECAGDLFLKSLKRLRQQWASDIMRGPFLPVDLDVILDQHGPPRHGPQPLDLDIGPPITDLSEGMHELAAASSATSAEQQEAESPSSAASSEAAAASSKSDGAESVELHPSAGIGRPAQVQKEPLSAADGVHNCAAKAGSAAGGQMM